MRQLVIVAMLLGLARGTAAQEATREGPTRRIQFGAPVVKVTALRHQAAVMFGGRGGFSLTPSLVLGAGLYGTMTEVNARAGAVPDAPSPLDVKFENFGLEVEYALRPAAPTHMTFGAFAGGASARYAKDGTNEQHGETDFLLLLEPGAGIERAVAPWLHVNLAASYRLVRGVEQ